MEINKLTIIAGIIQLDNELLAKEYSEGLMKHFSSKLNNQCRTLISNERSTHLFHDINTPAKPQISENENFITAINGDPLLCNEQQEDSSIINHQIQTTTLDRILHNARGVFSGISINKNNLDTYLYTDKLGIRPIYIYNKDGLLIYSSLLKLIEELPFTCLEENKKGLNELLSIGFCLSNRTQFKYISRLDQSEFISIKDNTLTTHKYWDWTKIDNLEKTDKKNIKELHSIFQEAVKIRYKQSSNAIAFLSGGLDSRSIVASLKELTDDIHTFNFGTKQAQDNVFAKLFAEEINTTHHEKFFKTLSFPNWSQLISNSIDEDINEVNRKDVWSGDGGSVGLGYVYINEELITLLKDQKIEEATKSFIQKNKIEPPISILKKQFKTNSKECLQDSISAEIDINSSTLEKAMYFFLLFNDQKRHLDQHFETIHQHKVELILPFFDSKFIQKIIRIPAEDMLYHNTYMEWFNLLPEYARKTPWQTYPNHAPCPVKFNVELGYQWQNRSKSSQKLQDYLLYLKIRKQPIFAKHIQKTKTQAIMIAHLLNIKNYSFLINKMALLKK